MLLRPPPLHVSGEGSDTVVPHLADQRSPGRTKQENVPLVFLHPSDPDSKAATAFVPPSTSQLTGPSNRVRDYWEHPGQLFTDLSHGSKRIRDALIAASGNQAIENAEPLSLGELTVLGVGSLLFRRGIPLRAAPKGTETGGGTGGNTDLASSCSIVFRTKDEWAMHGRADLGETLQKLEDSVASWAKIHVPKINEDGTRVELKYLHLWRPTDVRGALAGLQRALKDLGISSARVDQTGTGGTLK